MKILKKIIKTILILLITVWIGFWLYKQYALKDFNEQEALKTGRIIKIRDMLYSIYTINNYPILLMSKDNGKTWYQKNFRGIFGVFPELEILDFDPMVDIISVRGKVSIIKHVTKGDWEPFDGFYIFSYSIDEGNSWHIEYKLFSKTTRQYLYGTSLKNKPNTYSYYDKITNTNHKLKQDPSEIVQIKK